MYYTLHIEVTQDNILAYISNTFIIKIVKIFCADKFTCT